ncbi:MAG: response regulator transcription factor [Candidatus Microsaccharimonas sp.]
MKILVVEDNPRLADRIQRKLQKTYLIDFVNTGHEALVQLADIEYGVILLDLGLPDMHGVEVCKKIRDMKINIPILVLTGVDDMPTRVELLNMGADDYVTKPFDSDELKARISALLRRRARPILPQILTYHGLVIDPSERTVERDGIAISLRRKEFDILEYLVMNSGRVLTRKMILDHVWSADSTSWLGTIDVHIKHLRDKIDRPFATSFIRTIYGVGYKVDSPE